ncbi:hypothetical protein HDU96_009623 [Phlyctochytrium bullatum]|nr:hypothetical protein HDU96_009623 [Phlyctochytrium bullatum]
MNETRAWELDTFRGHYNNVSCVVFHPRQELILSNAEDKTISIWDMSKRTRLQTFRQEHDRFWILTAHPELNLFAAGHDSGFIVFKLERERPAQAIHQNHLFYVKDRVLRLYDYSSSNDVPVLNLKKNQIIIKDLQNNPTKQFKPPGLIVEIFSAGPKHLLLTTSTSVILYDIEMKSAVAELNIGGVRYASWSSDGATVALLSKNAIAIATKSLEQLALIHETMKIKSGAWDESGVFMYSTQNHIKYALPQGDNGIIRTVEQPVYLTRVKGKNLYCLDRDGKVRVITIDPTEYRFKLALVRRNYDEVLHVIRTSNLVGQAIIAYLQKKGYPEVEADAEQVALHFVKENKTRFDLAIECGNLDVASETAQAMDKEEYWNLLAVETLRQGNLQVVETAYKRVKNFDKLSFLYFITGNRDKLKKMLKIAEARIPLAYLTAQTYGFEAEAAAILQSRGGDAPSALPAGSRPELLLPPIPILHHWDINWPTLAVSRGFFDSGIFSKPQSALVAAGGTVDSDAANGDWDDDDEEDAGGPEAVRAGASQSGANDASDGEGWDSDSDGAAEVPTQMPGPKANQFTMPHAGINIYDSWVKNSNLAIDHIAAGSFESAMDIQLAIKIGREYLLVIGIIRQQRSGEKQGLETKRLIELAAYATHCDLQQIEHRQLLLSQAIKTAKKYDNKASAAQFAKRYLETGPPLEKAREARLLTSEPVGGDSVALDYDQHNPFAICAKSYTPIYRGNPMVKCPFFSKSAQSLVQFVSETPDPLVPSNISDANSHKSAPHDDLSARDRFGSSASAPESPPTSSHESSEANEDSQRPSDLKRVESEVGYHRGTGPVEVQSLAAQTTKEIVASSHKLSQVILGSEDEKDFGYKVSKEKIRRILEAVSQHEVDALKRFHIEKLEALENDFTRKLDDERRTFKESLVKLKNEHEKSIADHSAKLKALEEEEMVEIKKRQGEFLKEFEHEAEVQLKDEKAKISTQIETERKAFEKRNQEMLAEAKAKMRCEFEQDLKSFKTSLEEELSLAKEQLRIEFLEKSKDTDALEEELKVRRESLEQAKRELDREEESIQERRKIVEEQKHTLAEIEKNISFTVQEQRKVHAHVACDDEHQLSTAEPVLLKDDIDPKKHVYFEHDTVLLTPNLDDEFDSVPYR